MSKKRDLVLFIAPSLDGYIATKDESLEWLYKVEGDNGFSDIETIFIYTDESTPSFQ